MASTLLLRRLPFSPHVRPIHAFTYLLGVSLFSISFLVFLNSSVSFVLTDLHHITAPLGKIVGILGFADELVAIVAAPVWGVVSDGRLGTRGVVVCGYVIIAVSLTIFVLVGSVYPGLLLARMLFSVGGAAVATMVSAILPEMTSVVVEEGGRQKQRSGKLAGLVGLFTGLGALLALGVFLPLPTRFLRDGHVGREEAVRRAFYTVSLTAIAVAAWCLFALPKPLRQGEGEGGVFYDAKRWLWTKVWGGDPTTLPSPPTPAPSPAASIAGGLGSIAAAFGVARQDSRLALAYLGSFVARSTSVGISLFIPLFVNHYFTSTGLCPVHSRTPKDCKRAYILAAQLTGVSQLTALLLAPAFGYWTDHPPFKAHRNAPLVLSAILGVAGFATFASLPNPEPAQHPTVWLAAALMGVAQIGGIVCSLGILGRSIVSPHSPPPTPPSDQEESAPLLPGNNKKKHRQDVKGGIAGVYSLSGGVGILAITLLGGVGFDRVASTWPFWMLAAYEAAIVVAGVVEGVWGRRETE